MMSLFALLCIASCSDNDGDWDPMKWKMDTQATTSGIQQSGTTFTFPKEGGTLTLNCSNYQPWISVITLPTGERVDIYGEDDSKHFKTSMLEVTITGHTLTATMQPNTTGETRVASIQLSAGDVFCYFKFEQ